MKKLSLFLFLATVGLQLSAVHPDYTPVNSTRSCKRTRLPYNEIKKSPRKPLPKMPIISTEQLKKSLSREQLRMFDF